MSDFYGYSFLPMMQSEDDDHLGPLGHMDAYKMCGL
jgi:hypothetical protein